MCLSRGTTTSFQHLFAAPTGYLSLPRNKLVGVPENVNLRGLFYMDISFNNIVGTIPQDWMSGRDSMIRLHHLYIDHNQFSGPVPQEITEIGNGRLEQLYISDNLFTGTFPGNYSSADFLQRLEM